MPLFNELNQTKNTRISLHYECDYCDGTEKITRTLKLSFPYEKVVVMNLRQMTMLTKESFPEMLKNCPVLDCLT